jgi:hypothetical protein
MQRIKVGANKRVINCNLRERKVVAEKRGQRKKFDFDNGNESSKHQARKRKKKNSIVYI